MISLALFLFCHIHVYFYNYVNVHVLSSSLCIIDRNLVESEAETIYDKAVHSNVAFLVIGDPLCATTHTDLILRAREKGAAVEIIHNTSVMAGVADCGLSLYQYGYTVSIPYFDDEATGRKSKSYYNRIKYNKDGGMHSLCLLDIKVKEPDYKSLSSGGKLKYLPPKFMSVNIALLQLLQIEEEYSEGVVTRDTLAVGMARLGQSSQKIVFGTVAQLMQVDFGAPLHCLTICGEIHPLESEFLKLYQVKEEEMVLKLEDLESHKLYPDIHDNGSSDEEDA